MNSLKSLSVLLMAALLSFGASAADQAPSEFSLHSVFDRYEYDELGPAKPGSGIRGFRAIGTKTNDKQTFLNQYLNIY